MKTPALDVNRLFRLHILKNTGMESILGLLEHCRVFTVDKGDVLLRKGQKKSAMFLILSGELNIYLNEPGDEPVAILGAGETVGEMSVIDHAPVSADVVAAEQTELIEVDEETFWRLTRASHEFSINLLRLLAGRIRFSNSNLHKTSIEKSKFEKQALIDGLTGLRNRRWMQDTLPRMLSRFRRSNRSISLMMVDVDHFKDYNDRFGHAAGDLVLREVSRALCGRLRPTDRAVRYGGEEFVVILPDTGLDGAVTAAERQRKMIGGFSIQTPEGKNLPPVTISIGVAQLNGDENASTLLSRVDRALYRAKENGRNRTET